MHSTFENDMSDGDDYSAFLPADQYIFCVCFFSAANVSQEGDMSFHFDIRLYVLECSICLF